MKGARLDWIFTVLERIGVASKMGYKERYELIDLADDDFITKYLLVNNISPVVEQITTDIVGGETPNPITVSYEFMTNPTLIFRNSDGSNYSGAVNNVDTGTEIVLTGDDTGDGTFADSFVFTIKP